MADIDIENEDVGNVEDMLLGNEGKMPSRKQLLEMLESSEISEELRENLRSMLKGNTPELFGGYGGGTFLALFFVVIIFSIILFFGYKLYKSLKEKETKREEKKKAKQLKKKK